MKINLFLIESELREFVVSRHISSPPYELTLDGFCCWTDEESALRPETLYVIGAENLNKLSGRELESKRISFLILGTPPAVWKDSPADYLAVSGDMPLPTLVNRVEGAFRRYRQWEDRLQQCLDQGEGLREMAAASEKLIHNCIYIQGAFFQALLVYTPSDCEDTPEIRDYLSINTEKDGGFIAPEEIYELISDENYKKAVQAQHPTMFDGLYSYRTLYYNLRNDGLFVARLMIDEVVEPITEKDYALIVILGHYFEKYLAKGEKNEFTRIAGVEEMMQGLLHHVLLPEPKIVAVLEKLGWDPHDQYLCLLLRTKIQGDPADVLPPLAADLTRILGSYCYTILDERIIFVCNLSSLRRDAADWSASIVPELRNRLVSGCVSSSYRDFKNLFYYYNMTKVLETVGTSKDPDKWFYFFHQYYADCFLQISLQRTLPEVFVPDPLKAVVNYARQKGTELTNSLRVYLNNERNLAKTARDLYVHRNTCMQRIGHIEKILGLSLDDPDNRLMLLLAFRIMERERTE